MERPLQRVLPLWLCALAVAALQCGAIHFYITPGEKRCFEEDLPVASKITGIARLASGPGTMEIDVWVTTLTGQVLYHRRGTPEGMVSFTTPRAPGPSDMDDDIGVGEGAGPPQKDTYRVCVEHQLRASDAVTQGARRLVSYRLNDARIPRLPGSGPRATSKHAGVLVNRLQEMHESLTGMVGDLDELERREFRLLERNYRMSTRLAILAAVSLIALVATSVIQYNYYRVYFKAKKIC